MLRKRSMLLCLVMGFMLIMSSAFAADPKVSADQEAYKLDKKIKIGISGEGFSAGQEIRLVLITAEDGSEYDIGYALEPEPSTDKSGKWSTTWDAGRFVSKKMVKAGTNPILVTDADYNTLAEFTISFEE